MEKTQKIKEVVEFIKNLFWLRFDGLKESLSTNEEKMFEGFLELAFENLDNMTELEDIVIQFEFLEMGFQQFENPDSEEFKNYDSEEFQ